MQCPLCIFATRILRHSGAEPQPKIESDFNGPRIEPGPLPKPEQKKFTITPTGGGAGGYLRSNLPNQNVRFMISVLRLSIRLSLHFACNRSFLRYSMSFFSCCLSVQIVIEKCLRDSFLRDDDA